MADVFYSADRMADDGDHSISVDVEYLNDENCSGMPTHKLRMKPNTPIMLMRNLNPPEGETARAWAQPCP